MKKSLIAVMLSIVMAVGSVGAVPVFAAEEGSTTETTVDAEEVVTEQKEAAPEFEQTVEVIEQGDNLEEIADVSLSEEDVIDVTEDISDVEDPAGEDSREEEEISVNEPAEDGDVDNNVGDEPPSANKENTQETDIDEEQIIDETVAEEQIVNKPGLGAVVLSWPVPGHTMPNSISQWFHDGCAIDISDGSIAGANIVAALGGTVTHKFECGTQHYKDNHTCNGFGTGIVIKGDDGRIYQYAHMQAGSIPSNVYIGAYVAQGQVIGRVGTTGNSSGNHLHFGISYGTYYSGNGVDPSKETYTTNQPPYGALDYCSGGTGTFSVAGWAVDPDEPSKSLEIRVHIGAPAGQEGGEYFSTMATVPRPDINDAGIPGNHGYDATFKTSLTGTQTVYIYAIHSNGENGPLLTMGTVNITANQDPYGALDGCTGGIGTFSVCGWAVDPDEPSKSLEIRVHIGAPAGQGGEYFSTMATIPRPDLNNVGIPGDHGYDATFKTSLTGTQTVYIYAIHSNGANGPLIATGTVNITKPIDLSKATITLEKTQYTYDGTQKKPKVKSINSGNITLKEGTDYTLSYKNNTNAGTASVTVSGNNQSTINSKTLNFTITKAAQTISANGLTLKVGESGKIAVEGAKGTLTYKSASTSVATVTSDGTVTAVAAGTTTITISAAQTSNYNAGTTEITVQVTSGAINVSKLKITVNDTGLIYNGEAKTPAVTVKQDGEVVTKGFKVTYQNNVEAGLKTATAVITGDKVIYTGTKKVAFSIYPSKTSRGDMFNLANNVKVTWKEVPGAKYYKVYREGITDPSESLEEPVIVTERLIGWDQQPGLTNGHAYKYTIVASLTGKDDPSGDSPLSYSKLMYRLKTVVIRSVKNTEPGKVTVKYDKTTSGDSYVLAYSENEDLSGAKTKVVLGANNTSYTLSGLKKGKTYYISIRVRKKVDGIDYYTTFGVPKKIKITQ